MTGHSLGGGVAALLGVLLLLRDLQSDPNNAGKEEGVPICVYSYATIACVGADLAELVEYFVFQCAS